MGKSIRGSDPFVLDARDVEHVEGPKLGPRPAAAPSDPFVLGEGDRPFVKKKVGAPDSGNGSFPTPSGLSSGDDVNKSAQAFASKNLTVNDQDVLAQTDWGKQQGLDMPDAWKSTYVQAHNGPKTTELVNSVKQVLNANYPQAPPGSPQNSTREQIFSTVQSGDVPAIQKVKKSIQDSKQQQILQIQNHPQGPAPPAMGMGDVASGGGEPRPLSEEQKRQVAILQNEMTDAQNVLDQFTAQAIVRKKENQGQLKVDLSPQNLKFGAGPNLAANSIGYELEKTVGISKNIPNNEYARTRAGLEAIMSTWQMDANDLLSQGLKTKNPELIKKGQEKMNELQLLQARYDNLDNQYPDVGTYKTARYLGDILSEIKPQRLVTTTADVMEAAQVAEKAHPGFLQSHGKFVDIVAKSEGDWIGLKSGMVPQGGVIGGAKAGTENVMYGGAAFLAKPFGMKLDPKTAEVAEVWLQEAQVRGTSAAGAQPTKIVYDQQSKAYREIPNESYGKWDFNSSMYSLGKAIPTLVQWVVLDKGIGGLAKGAAAVGLRGLNAVGEGVATGTNALIGAKEALTGYEALKLAPGFEKAAGLYGTTYITSFDENRKLADNLIKDPSSLGEAKKNALANLLTLSTAGIFSMMDYSPSKAVESALAKNAAPDVLKFLEKANWKDLSIDETTKLIKGQILPRVKAVVEAAGQSAKAGAKLGTAGVIDQKIKDFTSLLVNPDQAKTSSVEDNLHSFVDQVLLMTLAGLPGMVSSGAFPHTAKDALYQAGVLAPQFIDRINEQVTAGDLDPEQGNKMIAMVKTMGEEVGRVQPALNKEGLPLTTKQKREIAVSSFRKRAAEMMEQSGIPIGTEGVGKDADEKIDQVREQNSWRAIEESVPFQTARDLDTGKRPSSPDDIDPDRMYTYEKNGQTVTENGAELSNHLIHGEYEQVKTEKTDGAQGKEAEPTDAQTGDKNAEAKTGTEKKLTDQAIEAGKAAIEKAIADKKLTGVYIPFARSEPAAFLKEIADQVYGQLATGEKVSGEGLQGEDAELSARDLYGDDLVEAAKAMYPKEAETKGRPPLVARHGETNANKAHKPSDDQAPLNATGEKQATELGKELAEKGYDNVLPSDTERTRATAEKVVEQTGGEIISNPELSKLLKEWDQTGGEPIDAFARRIAKARLAVQDLPEGTAVIAHGKVMGMLEALDRADGDIDKAIKIFDKTKVYGNADTYIPSQKTKNNGTEKRENGQNQDGDQGSPEKRQEGNGQPAAVRQEGPQHGNVQETAEKPDGGKEKGDVLTQQGAAATEPAAPSRKKSINDLLDKTEAFNKLRKNNPNKGALLNEIRLKAQELGLTVDYGKGFAIIKDKNRKKVFHSAEETNAMEAKNFDLADYSDKTKNIINEFARSDLPLSGLEIVGMDGRRMSDAQKENAMADIRAGKNTYGAKAVYDAMQRMVDDGHVELFDPISRQRVGVPLEDYMDSFRHETVPLTDSDLTELNTLLGEDAFGRIFDDIFAEETQLPEREQSTEPAGQAEPASAGPTDENKEAPGGAKKDTGPGGPAAPPPIPQEEIDEEPEEPEVTGIRNIIVNTERADRSLQPVIKEARTNFQEIWDHATALVKSGQADPRSLVNTLAGSERPLVDATDNALILMDRIDLTNQRIDLLAGIEKAQKEGNDVAEEYLSKRLIDIEQQITQNDEVADRTGQALAVALSSRRMLATLDFSLSSLTAQIRRLYPEGEVPSTIHERLAQIEKDHAELMKKFNDREEAWKKQQAEKAFQEAKEKVSSEKPKKQKKEPLTAKQIADKIRALRPKGGDTAQANLFSLPIAVYDTALVTIANLIEAGAKIGKAIKEAIKNIEFESDKDRQDFIDHINGAVDEDAPEAHRAALVAQILEDAETQNATSLVQDNITPLRRIASSYIKEGQVKTLDELVDQIHADLEAHLPDLTKRQVRDAFSGYGDTRLPTASEMARQVRDLQRQAQLVSQFEDVMNKQKPQRKGKKPTKPSAEVTRLKKEVEKAMKENGITWEQPPRNPQEQAQRAITAVKTRLQSEIDDLNRRIRQKEPPRGRIPADWDQETISLMQQRDALKETLADTTSNVKLSDEMRVRRLENSLKKQIADYDLKISQGGGPLREKANPVTTPALEALRAQRDTLSAINRKLMVDNSPKSTPQQIALEAYKERIGKRIANLGRRASEGDFEPKARVDFKKDAEAIRLDTALKSTESRFYALKRKAERENRSRLQKVFDKIAAWKRFAVLSGLPSMGKILTAVTYRTIGSPAEELVGATVKYIPGVAQVASQAPREGEGFTAGTEGAALNEWVKAKTYKDFLQVLTRGRGELDMQMGKYMEDNPEVLEFFGRIHGSLKNFAKRAEFARSYAARIEFARKKGFNTATDELVHLTAAMDAYTDAQRSIFMQDNALTAWYFKSLKQVEKADAGWMGRTAAFLARFSMPVVKVPTNFIAETGTYAVGVVSGITQIVYNAINGQLSKLSPQEADLIMRSLKKGSIGLTLGIIGYLYPQLAGGYWQRGEKRDPEDLNPGEIMFYGHRIPRWATHFPALEVMQLGSTLRRSYERRTDKGEEQPKAVTGSIFDAAGGMLGEVPLFEQPSDIMNRIKYGEWDKVVGDEFKSLNPQIIQNAASWTDQGDGKLIKRDPKNPWEQFETGVPGLREQVPEK